MKVPILTCVFFLAAIGIALACECGLEGGASRIHKGTVTQANKYPWMVDIKVKRGSAATQCAGSLIDEQHIITVAHCVYLERYNDLADPEKIEAHIGLVMAKTQKHTKQAIVPAPISKVWVHPQYKSEGFINDIAILTLAQPVAFNRTVSPICLPNREPDFSKFTIAGWGTQSIMSQSTDHLMSTQVDFLSKDECWNLKVDYEMKKKFENANFAYNHEKMRAHVSESVPQIDDRFICAVNKETRGGHCTGDTGTALMHKGNDGLQYMVGIATNSWDRCGVSEFLSGLYTRVLPLKETILSQAPNACFKDAL